MLKIIRKIPIHILNLLAVTLIFVFTKVALWLINIITGVSSFYLEVGVFFSLFLVVSIIIHRLVARKIKMIYQGLNKISVDPSYRIQKLPGLWGGVSDEINKLADKIDNTRSLMDKVLTNLPVAVLVADGDGEIKMCNPAAKQLFLCDGCNKNISKRKCPHKLFDWTINTNKPIRNYDYYFDLPNGETKHLLIDTRLLLDAKGDGAKILLSALDISGRQQMWDQMQQTEKISMISELAAGVAHEIKNPLTSARGLLQLISDRFNKEDAANQHIGVALESLNRINVIINEMEQLSIPNKPNLTFNQLDGLLEDISILIDSEGVYHDVTVKRVYQPGLPLAVIDAIQMKQVFLNLAINAIKAMPHGGTLTIKVGFNKDTNEFVISFADNGVGMTKAEINKIFNPFYSSSADSTGLGLTVCYQTVKSHGGHIDVQSEKDKGSTFTIYLPAVIEARAIC